MTPITHTLAPVQAGSLVILDITPSVLFVVVSVGKRRVLLRHPNGSAFSVPLWRVRPLMG